MGLLNQHKQLILNDSAVLTTDEAWSKEVNVLVAHLAELKMQPGQWGAFLSRWTWSRIFNDNRFEPVWADTKEILGLTEANNNAPNAEQVEEDADALIEL